MNIGILDVDGHNFPNLALMKISAWHKKQGDKVEMFFPMSRYDRVYMSKVFTFSPYFNTCINANEVIKGGTGYGLSNRLPDEIEHIYPDYDIYNIKDTAYGFLTRGCPRKCDFCIVGSKEGACSKKVANLKEFWNGQREIKLLDPNLLASKNHLELLDQLVESRAWIDITQGFDIRLTTPKNIEKIKQMKIKMLHFAWDKAKDEKIILEKLKQFKELTGFNHRKLGVYMLTNFDTSFEYDLYRVYKLKELGYDPYVMIYEKWKAPQNIKHLQRWVNCKFIFRSASARTFEEYKTNIS